MNTLAVTVAVVDLAAGTVTKAAGLIDALSSAAVRDISVNSVTVLIVVANLMVIAFICNICAAVTFAIVIIFVSVVGLRFPNACIVIVISVVAVRAPIARVVNVDVIVTEIWRLRRFVYIPGLLAR